MRFLNVFAFFHVLFLTSTFASCFNEPSEEMDAPLPKTIFLEKLIGGEKECLKKFEDTVNKMPESQYTEGFIKTVDQLSKYVKKEPLCERLAITCHIQNIPSKHQKEFVRTIKNIITFTMDAYTVLNIIDIVYKISPNNYQNFEKTLNKIIGSFPFVNWPKHKAIDSLSNISPDHYTEEFGSFVKYITPGFCGYHNLEEAITLAAILEKNQYQSVKETFDSLKEGVEKENYDDIISALICVPLKDHPLFVKNVNTFYALYGKEKENIIAGLKKCDREKITLNFIKTAIALTPKKSFIEVIISSLKQVDPSLYNQKFIDTVNKLSFKFTANKKSEIIKNLKGIDLSKVTENHILATNEIYKGCNGCVKGKLFLLLLKFDSTLFSDTFKNVVNSFFRFYDYESTIDYLFLNLKSFQEMENVTQITLKILEKMEINLNPTNYIYDIIMKAALRKIYYFSKENGDDYIEKFINTYKKIKNINDIQDPDESILKILGKIRFIHYEFITLYFQNRRNYFDVVPGNQLVDTVNSDMTEEELHDTLENLYRQYFIQRPLNVKRSVASEIHNFSNQNIKTDSKKTNTFNSAVLEHLKKTSNPTLSYDDAINVLTIELEYILKAPLKSTKITKVVFDWVIKSIMEDEKENLRAAVTYLQGNDPTNKNINLWLCSFMEESYNAYRQNHGSCIKGVNERIVTSLRNISLNDPVLLDYFKQAETSFMIKTKSKTLSNYKLWAKKLTSKGIKKTSSETTAKQYYEESLREYFDIQNDEVALIINCSLDRFSDSTTGANDGTWSNIKKHLQ